MAKRKMTREEALAWKARWEMVNAREREELRAASLEHKMQQLAALMVSVDRLGWRDRLKEEKEAERAAWTRLRDAYGL